MPKSRNRKNHSKKVAARNQRLKQQQNALTKQMEIMKEEYIKKMAEEAKEKEVDAGEVPLTLG
jgi:cell division protein FtsB|tara:strand:- start:89 stop:277 length:189 start_codon:yes stop_codon:yes gene_type:complete